MYQLTNGILKEWVMFTIRLHCKIVEDNIKIGTFQDVIYSNSRITVMWGNPTHHHIVDSTHPFVLVSFDSTVDPAINGSDLNKPYMVHIKLPNMDITDSFDSLPEVLDCLAQIKPKAANGALRSWKEYQTETS